MNSLRSKIALGFIIILMLSIASCKNRQSNKRRGKAGSITSANLFKEVNNNQADFEYFTSRMKSKYDDGNQSLAFNVSLRMQKDEYIWMSVSFILGIEVARAYITKDSIKVMNKVNKRAFLSDYTYLQRFTDVPLSLDQLQSLLIGNNFYDPDENTRTDTIQGYHTMSKTVGAILNYVLVDPKNYRIYRNSLKDTGKQQQVDVFYSDFEKQEKSLIPQKVKIDVKTARDVHAEFEHTNISLAPIQPINFRIPSSYAR